MLRTIEATIDKSGKVKLAEPIALRGPRRALVTILDEGVSADVPNEAAILAESALVADWSGKDEDEAWAHLADLPDLDRKAKKGRK